MSPESSGSMEPDDAKRPDDDWPDDDWPDEETGDDQTGPSWPEAAQGAAGGDGSGSKSGGQDGGPRREHLRPLVLAAVAVVALAAGIGGALAVARGLSSPSPAATPASSSPSSSAPGAGGGPFPGGGSTGQTGRLFLGGTVAAVSTTSITIGGPGHTVTAAVTAATRVTGKVTSISSVKVGDHVSAQITESGGKATATAIQDPASLPSSGGLP